MCRYNWGPILRFGGGRGQEFATAYSVQYWSSGAWHTYTNLTGHSVMTGNENTWEASVQQLVPPIVTSRVRVLPRSRHPRTVSNFDDDQVGDNFDDDDSGEDGDGNDNDFVHNGSSFLAHMSQLTLALSGLNAS